VSHAFARATARVRTRAAGGRGRAICAGGARMDTLFGTVKRTYTNLPKKDLPAAPVDRARAHAT
jgi:hypothetical protein